MTLRELSQLYYLNREIETNKRRLEEIKSKLSVGGQKLSDMPKAQQYENRMERYIAELIDLEGTISAQITQCLYERNRLERYIADIPDSLTRQIFTLRFVNGMSWVQVAFSVGGGNTEASVKMTCYRYINGQNSQKK